MRNSKRSQNQKKRGSRLRRSRRQSGSSDPYKTRRFNVYYNYVISNFQNEGGRNGEILTRQLNPYEIGVCRDLITETRRIIIGDHAPQYADLIVGNVIQLQEPHNGKHFRLLMIVKNKTHQEALDLINGFMDETVAGGYVTFDWPHRDIHESNDQNRYVNTELENIEIVESGYRG